MADGTVILVEIPWSDPLSRVDPEGKIDGYRKARGERPNGAAVGFLTV